MDDCHSVVVCVLSGNNPEPWVVGGRVVVWRSGPSMCPWVGALTMGFGHIC